MKLLGCVGVIAIAVLGSLLEGLVLSIMWGWFVVPVFDAPSLSIPVAISLSLIVGFLTTSKQATSKTDDKELDEAMIGLLAWSIGQPIIYLALGYLVKLFM